MKSLNRLELFYYHGSKTKNIEILKPSMSIHGDDYVYLTTSKAVALIYTVNAIEVYFKQNYLECNQKFQPWYSYGFDENQIPVIEEYYPNATYETYHNQSGYIYICEKPKTYSNPTNIHNAIVTKEHVKIIDSIFIPDIYDEILKLEKDGVIKIKRYENMTDSYLSHIYNMIRTDIDKYQLIENPNHNYTIFLKAKLPFLFK